LFGRLSGLTCLSYDLFALHPFHCTHSWAMHMHCTMYNAQTCRLHLLLVSPVTLKVHSPPPPSPQDGRAGGLVGSAAVHLRNIMKCLLFPFHLMSTFVFPGTPPSPPPWGIPPLAGGCWPHPLSPLGGVLGKNPFEYALPIVWFPPQSLAAFLGCTGNTTAASSIWRGPFLPSFEVSHSNCF